jgi:penicillin-binding protein 1B
MVVPNGIKAEHITGLRHRTVVLRSAADTAERPFPELIRPLQHLPGELWDRVPARVKALGRRVAQPQVLLVLGILVAAFSVVTIYYYNKLAAEIDARLQSSALDSSVGIFTGPFNVSVGDRLPIADLTDYLQAAGYHQRQTGVEENIVGSFDVTGDEVEVVPGSSSLTGVYPVRIRIDQKSGRVAWIKDPNTGKPLSSAPIEGELLAAVRDGDRRKKIAVQFSDIPESLRDAIVAVEDRRFFSHNGVDWRGILRALKADIEQGELVQGGSTLTQQLIKNDFLTADRTFSRKLKEAAMAVILESRLSKEQIFTVYCNDVYLGQSGTFAINGFAQAAQVYFDKQLKELTLSEAAFLAGLICAPNRYSAHRDMKRALERRNRVLDAMAETEAISPQVSEEAKAEPLKIKKHETTQDYGTSYFIDYAQRYLDNRYPAKRLASRRITTTMDPRLQRAAYGALTRQTEKLDKILARSTRKGAAPQQVQGALVALDAHTGEVLAMIGGRSYDESQLNRATDAKRQPGSAFKPFVYAAALDRRSYTAASLISDTRQTFTYDGGRAEYKPSNYHGAFTNRNVTLREALTRSLNVPSVALAMRVGLSRVADVAEKSGLERPRVYPSMALGTSEVTPLELAGAYTAFANHGMALRPIPIRSRSGTDGVAATERASSTYTFSPQVAYLMTTLLQSVVDSGTASRLRGMGLKGAMAGKTGTTSDGWFVGYTPRIVCAVWVGFDDNRDLRMKASDAALPMWADFMKQAVDLRPELGADSFSRPGGIVTVEIDPTTGCLAGPESLERRLELFIAGTEPYSTCNELAMTDAELLPGIDEQVSTELPTSEVEDYSLDPDHVTVEVCAETGLVASPDCPPSEKRIFEAGKEPQERCRVDLHPGLRAFERPEGTRRR